MFFPKYIYATEWTEKDINYIKFFTDDSKLNKLLSQNREQTFFLLQHKSTFTPNLLHRSTSYIFPYDPISDDLYDPISDEYPTEVIYEVIGNRSKDQSSKGSRLENQYIDKAEYQFVYGHFRFNAMKEIIPAQEWLETKLSFLQNRQLQSRKPYAHTSVKPENKIVPSLFFALIYNDGMLSCEVEKTPLFTYHRNCSASGKILWKKQRLFWSHS